MNGNDNCSGVVVCPNFVCVLYSNSDYTGTTIIVVLILNCRIFLKTIVPMETLT